MSGIYGLVAFDDRPVERQLAAMGGAIACFGPDGGGAWSSPGAGLGQLVSHHSPESARECGPVVLPDGSVVTSAARLDNRDELIPALELDVQAPDGQIVAAAWMRWGEDCVQHLLGDWGLAAWDPRTRRLFVARDHLGHTALHYVQADGVFAFASNRKALFALPFVPRRLNELRLAQHLVTWPADGFATIHEGVFRLPPAHALRVASGVVSSTRFWRLEEVPDVRCASDGEYVERFVELFSVAVRARVRGTGDVASTLSAGLDSGAVTALAARHVTGARRLVAYTSVPRFPEIARVAPALLFDEWPLAHAVAERCALEHHAVPAADWSLLRAIDTSLAIHDEPEFAVPNLPWIFAILSAARDRGARIVLTGQMGNGGISWSGDRQRVRRALRAGDWRTALRELDAWRRPRNLSWARTLRVVVAPWRASLAHRLRGRAALEQSIRGLIQAGFARRIDIVARMLEAGHGAAAPLLEPRAQRGLVLLPEVSPNGALWHEKAAAFGVDVRDPTADARLLEFCLGIPDEQFGSQGRDRWLVRRAVEGLLPPEVQWNVRRGVQGGDTALRLLAERDAVEALLADMAASAAAREYLDLESIGRAWSALQGRLTPRSLQDAALLSRGLLYGRFLFCEEGAHS